jgi:hypothetical protein
VALRAPVFLIFCFSVIIADPRARRFTFHSSRNRFFVLAGFAGLGFVFLGAERHCRAAVSTTSRNPPSTAGHSGTVDLGLPFDPLLMWVTNKFSSTMLLMARHCQEVVFYVWSFGRIYLAGRRSDARLMRPCSQCRACRMVLSVAPGSHFFRHSGHRLRENSSSECSFK